MTFHLRTGTAPDAVHLNSPYLNVKGGHRLPGHLQKPIDESPESQVTCDSSGLFSVFEHSHIIVVDVSPLFHPLLPTENHIDVPSNPH